MGAVCQFVLHPRESFLWGSAGHGPMQKDGLAGLCCQRMYYVSYVGFSIWWQAPSCCIRVRIIHRLSSVCGRCCMCFALDPVSDHGPKTKHMQHLPQADERRCILLRISLDLVLIGCKSPGINRTFICVPMGYIGHRSASHGICTASRIPTDRVSFLLHQYGSVGSSTWSRIYHFFWSWSFMGYPWWEMHSFFF